MLTAAFRVDASPIMGLGHLMRCLTLADALRLNGWSCVFLTKDHEAGGESLIRFRGYECHILPLDLDVDPVATAHGNWLGGSQRKDAERVERYLLQHKIHLLIVDHYGLDQNWERVCKPRVGKILVIDDLADRTHVCDILLDQTVSRKRDVYFQRVPEECWLLLGTDFALLRPQFSEVRRAEGGRKLPSRVSRVLISMGGTDPENTTLQIMQNIVPESRQFDFSVTVILGAAAVHIDRVKRAAQELGYTLLISVNDMAGVMIDHDLAIGAAGSTSWERCCLGLPSLMFVNAANQLTIASNLEQHGAAINFGKVTQKSLALLKNQIAQFAQFPERLLPMIKSCEQCCDGLGVSRVVEVLEEGILDD